jgi:hypothetical protein
MGKTEKHWDCTMLLSILYNCSNGDQKAFQGDNPVALFYSQAH